MLQLQLNSILLGFHFVPSCSISSSFKMYLNASILTSASHVVIYTCYKDENYKQGTEVSRGKMYLGKKYVAIIAYHFL